MPCNGLIKVLEKDSQLFNSLIKKESLKDKAPEDLFPLSERDERLLLADTECEYNNVNSYI